MLRYLEMKVPPPIVAIIVALVMWKCRYIEWANFPLFSSMVMQHTLLFLLITVGFMIEVMALIKFRQHKTTINPINPNATSHIVQSGVYRVSRNPMYLGMQLQLLAFSFYLNGLWPLIVCFGYGLIIHFFQIKPEEKILHQLFGNEYRRYQKQVPRWIGFPIDK